MRWLVALVATAAVLALPADAAGSEQHTYVAALANGDSGFTHLVGVVHLTGRFEVTPSGRHVVVTVDDRGVLDGGAVHLWAWTGNREVLAGCVPVRTPVTVGGLNPGDRMVFIIGTPGYLRQPCPNQATVGVVTVTGVK